MRGFLLASERVSQEMLGGGRSDHLPRGIFLLVTNSDSYEQLAMSIDHELCIIQSVKHRAPPLLACRHHRKCPASVPPSAFFPPFRWCGGERTKRGEAAVEWLRVGGKPSKGRNERDASLAKGSERRAEREKSKPARSDQLDVL